MNIDWRMEWVNLMSSRECDRKSMHQSMMRAWDLKGDYDSISVALAIQADMRKPKDEQRSEQDTARMYLTEYKRANE